MLTLSTLFILAHGDPRWTFDFQHSKSVLLFLNKFIYLWLCWVFTAAHELSLVAMSKGYSLVAVLRLLTEVASLIVEHVLWGVQASVVTAHSL